MAVGWCCCQLVSMSECRAAALRGVPASAAAGHVTSLVGHVVGAFTPHVGALCDAYDTYLVGLGDASDTLRRLTETNATFAHYVQVDDFKIIFVYYSVKNLMVICMVTVPL